MGLSSSQARLLTLTSRMHAVEYKAQKLEAEKLQLANDSDAAYNEYLTALDATKIQYRVVNGDGTTSFNNATFAKLTEAGFLYNVGGAVCDDYESVKKAMLDRYGITITAGDSYTVLTNLVQEGYVVLVEQNPDAPEGYSYSVGDRVFEYKDEIDNNNKWRFDFNQVLYLEENQRPNATLPPPAVDVYTEFFKVFGDTTPSTSTKLQEVSDEVNLKKAEATYEAEMNRINKKDTQYDTQLSQLETERNAIKEEMETLKTVANDNVSRTFKIFS